MQTPVHLVECPRDAMQGWKHFIPTQQKIDYLQALLAVGFDTLDCGSFVSSKAIPQMADTAQVIGQLSLVNSNTKLLTIVANVRGAEEALTFDQVSYLGFPFSISPTFQLRNTNSSIEESLGRVEEIQELCIKNARHLVVYISMGFGNPYGDSYNEDLVRYWVGKLVEMEIGIISMADTVGLASADQVSSIMNSLIPQYPDTQVGVHLHSTAANWNAKVDAALEAGCLRFDGALKGIGGCPMADDELVGNMDTELMIPYFKEKGLLHQLDQEALMKASAMASQIFV
ncbi:MAG: hydroxymethylglutaryl-CoA lyase [Chitinophagaceae bacterium]